MEIARVVQAVEIAVFSFLDVSLPGDAEMDGVSWLPAKRWNCKGEPVAAVVVRFAFALCYPEKVFWFLR